MSGMRLGDLQEFKNAAASLGLKQNRFSKKTVRTERASKGSKRHKIDVDKPIWTDNIVLEKMRSAELGKYVNRILRRFGFWSRDRFIDRYRFELKVAKKRYSQEELDRIKQRIRADLHKQDEFERDMKTFGNVHDLEGWERRGAEYHLSSLSNVVLQF